MPQFGYSFTEFDTEKTVKASGREIRISAKHAREVCEAIRGMPLDRAKRYLEQVKVKERPIPFRRFVKKLGHRHGMRKAMVGKFPTKTAAAVLKVLQSAEGNAEAKGLDPERLRIVHASAYPGMKLRRAIPRAFGRTTPKMRVHTHVEIFLKETEGRGEVGV